MSLQVDVVTPDTILNIVDIDSTGESIWGKVSPKQLTEKALNFQGGPTAFDPTIHGWTLLRDQTTVYWEPINAEACKL